MMLQHAGKRRARRSWPIHGFCGPNGGGKTMAMVWDTLPTLEAGRPVLSTVRLLDYRNPRVCDGEGCDLDHTGEAREHMAPHPLYVPLTRWEQILEARNCDVLLDEVTGVASSRQSHAMPAPVANLLVQLRRRDVVLRWSAPSWARADTIIRECSQAVTYCRGLMPVAVHGEDRMWRHRRLGWWRTYDATEFEDFTVGKREAMKPLEWDLHWIPKSPARLAYDTFDAVLTVGDVSDSGRCVTCGGRRSAPACKCEDYVKSKARAGEARGPAERGAPDLPVPSPLEVGAVARRGRAALTLAATRDAVEADQQDECAGGH